MRWLEIVKERLETVELPPIPRSLQCLHPPRDVAKFIELADRPDINLNVLSKVIEKAPDLTASILRMANSSANAWMPKTHLVHTAVGRLGARRSKMLVMSAALQASLRRFQWDEADGALLIWEAQRRAMFARIAADTLGVDADYAYVAGMLQDLLLPCLRRGYPKEYSSITTDGISVTVGERKLFGWDHGLVTAGLLRAWNFPEEVVACVAFHHDLDMLLQDPEIEVSIVTASIGAALLPDCMRQEPDGIRSLVHLQEAIPDFDFFQIAAQTDEELERGDSAGAQSEPLSETLHRLAVGTLESQRKRDSWIGSQLGRYYIEEEIGKGAMGTVYRARHAMLRRPAAIKLMNTTHFDATALNRFEREAQATSQLQSPHTVHVYDYGITTNGVLYYVMEYLNGMTLRDLVERFGPQPESRVIHVLCQVCGSLEEAHSKGLIHRDIKPDNIALCESGGVCDFAKVLDFGLVHFLNGKVDAGEQKFLAGTPEYMSPESIYRPGEIDHRTDVYALGCVAYYLLTGQPVFPITIVPKLLKAHLEEAPDPPSIRAKRPIDDDLEAVILNCLEKNPDNRPPSAIQLAALLSACQASNKWSFEEARNWWDANRHSRSLYAGPAVEHRAHEQKPTRALDLPAAPKLPTHVQPVRVPAATEGTSIEICESNAFVFAMGLDDVHYGETFIVPIPDSAHSDGV